MLEGKKKILIGVIVGGVVIVGVIYYFLQKSEGEYIDFEDEYSNINENANRENILSNNDIADIKNSNSTNVKNMNTSENGEKMVIHITGEVVNPGVISLEEGARIIDAINEAGGTTENADLSKINLAYVLSDAQKLYIPSVNDTDDVTYVTEASGEDAYIVSGGAANQSGASQSANNGNGEVNRNSGKTAEKIMVNINTANEAELQKVPGIGQTIASRIVAYRKENGKFSAIEDLQKVSGIGVSKFNKMKEYICVK